jgi:hypothetical protein
MKEYGCKWTWDTIKIDSCMISPSRQHKKMLSFLISSAISPVIPSSFVDFLSRLIYCIIVFIVVNTSLDNKILYHEVVYFICIIYKIVSIVMAFSVSIRLSDKSWNELVHVISWLQVISYISHPSTDLIT